jgi:hypothetical protein
MTARRSIMRHRSESNGRTSLNWGGAPWHFETLCAKSGTRRGPSYDFRLRPVCLGEEEILRSVRAGTFR